jgi:hypothetical protein
MIRTHILPCQLPRPMADALNSASGVIYTQVLVTYWRVVRHKGHWLSVSRTICGLCVDAGTPARG